GARGRGQRGAVHRDAGRRRARGRRGGSGLLPVAGPRNGLRARVPGRDRRSRHGGAAGDRRRATAAPPPENRFMTTTVAAVARPVGQLLRDWRERRRLSQLELSSQTEISTRHISFVETGRSRPSADLILRLTEHLDVPLRDRNRVLLAAGYAPAYPET